MNAQAGSNDLRWVRLHFIIGKGVFLEILRRKDLYVLIILSLLYVLGILVIHLVGIENPETANFLQNLGMSLAWFFAHILMLLNSSRQIPDDLENHTIYPLLAKPLKRSHYILGKWEAVSLSGVLSLFIFLFFGWLLAPGQMGNSSLLLVQTLILYILSLALFSALGLFLSLLLPRSVNAIVLGLLVFLGGNIFDIVKIRAQNARCGALWNWIICYIPDFSLFNLTTRYTDGIGPLSSMQFAGLLSYGFIMTAVVLYLAVKVFERRRL
ncbi:ABC transporter permease subunit [Candidatus Sumerlaeota bacterium]|nr:ABC transporter permease subunit [Candidatus Sumerlaeota bacterium]